MEEESPCRSIYKASFEAYTGGGRNNDSKIDATLPIPDLQNHNEILSGGTDSVRSSELISK